MNFNKTKPWIERALGSHAALGVSRVMGHLADIPLPKQIMNPVVNLYSFSLAVNTDECILPEETHFPFNRFFGRNLNEEARPIDLVPDSIVSPADGQIVAIGHIDKKEAEFSIKNSRYNLQSLLGTETTPREFINGEFAVVYLHPRDYHRVHVPFDAALTMTRHIPGSRFPVTSWCEKYVDNIYDKNERMVFSLDLPSGGSFVIIMVAAFGVGNIVTRFDPGVDRRKAVCRERVFEQPVSLQKGEDLGAFLLGSTVVLIGSKGALELDERLEWGPIKMGQKIGKVLISNT